MNAADRVTNTVGHNPINRFELREGTGDLVLHFAGDASIEFLIFSSGTTGGVPFTASKRSFAWAAAG